MRRNRCISPVFLMDPPPLLRCLDRYASRISFVDGTSYSKETIYRMKTAEARITVENIWSSTAGAVRWPNQ